MSKHFPKQVIVMRRDLNMRRGKEISQGAHASMGALLSQMDEIDMLEGASGRLLVLNKDSVLKLWLEEAFTKIVLKCDSESEIHELALKAKQKGIPYCVITDNGATEFKGKKTVTCIAIGPAYVEDIDPITSHLELY